jgi:hypothetical protein
MALSEDQPTGPLSASNEVGLKKREDLECGLISAQPNPSWCEFKLRPDSWPRVCRSGPRHHRVNLARQAPLRATHILVIVVRDTGSVLVHAHDGGIDHPHRRIMIGGPRIRDLVPDASRPPAHEAIIVSQRARNMCHPIRHRNRFSGQSGLRARPTGKRPGAIDPEPT